MSSRFALDPSMGERPHQEDGELDFGLSRIPIQFHHSKAINIQECLSKLHSQILIAASTPIVNETSNGQKERVRGFERAEKARRRVHKDKRSELKRGRSSRDWD
ncbi:uncharacterized protein FIBRA_05192 [Fibroporia radiculosa]|uniref:Prokaryotic-type class I peptide chain release factors domain-containing protein n=1 Tax=Fibroporia radiculosa TaxID=599839 RepID=J4HX39_9APHY|nr:uncharacterized protein FIBRA_05192 [Fibroporia radiculosa]CCM03072.1 predicted protein [Fibroporia radiculosa]